MNLATNIDLRRFGEKAFASIEKNYSCGYRIAYLIARIMKNDSYYRFRFYKAFRKYEAAKNLLSKIIQYRKYSKYGHIIKAQIICKHIGVGFYFEHGNIVINKEAYLGDDVLLISNNCISGGNNGAPSIGNNVKIGWRERYWRC